MRTKGLEPSRPRGYWNLNPARLPISPHPHCKQTEREGECPDCGRLHSFQFSRLPRLEEVAPFRSRLRLCRRPDMKSPNDHPIADPATKSPGKCFRAPDRAGAMVEAGAQARTGTIRGCGCWWRSPRNGLTYRWRVRTETRNSSGCRGSSKRHQAGLARPFLVLVCADEIECAADEDTPTGGSWAACRTPRVR